MMMRGRKAGTIPLIFRPICIVVAGVNRNKNNVRVI